LLAQEKAGLTRQSSILLINHGDRESNRMNWLPWDLDLSMAGYFFCGTPA
jgi:hypothetical protein